jgi:hypothetical protein
VSLNRWVVYDIDFQRGSIRWSRELARQIPPIGRHVKNSFASETPIIDGDAVYVYFRRARSRGFADSEQRRRPVDAEGAGL